MVVIRFILALVGLILIIVGLLGTVYTYRMGQTHLTPLAIVLAMVGGFLFFSFRTR